MKQSLTLKPKSDLFQLKHNYEQGKLLTPDQVNFLFRHQRALSTPNLDPVLHYYLKPVHQKYAEAHYSFLLPHEKLNSQLIAQFKNRLALMLTDKTPHAKFRMTPEQFQQFRAMTQDELIFWHGNHFLTGAPFYPGGHPHVLFFQWGNFFGVTKYVVLPEERALKSNVLIHFEFMHDRYIDQCIHDYQQNLKKQYKIPVPPMPKPTPHTEQPIPTAYKIPRLTLSLPGKKDKDEKK